MKELLITIAIGVILLGVIIVCVAVSAVDYDPAWDEWEKLEKTDEEGDADDN